MNNRIVYIVSSKMVRCFLYGTGVMMSHKGGVRPGGATKSDPNPGVENQDGDSADLGPVRK